MKPYDVAISFLAKDQSIAGDIDAGLKEADLETFFFPRNQENLAGTDGLESMRAPFLNARLVVVLFRSPWGATPWTHVEETAIKERCWKSGWNSFIIIMLDEAETKPQWVPDTHIRFNFQTYGIEQAIGAIKMRAQELGAAPQRPSPSTIASRLREESELNADQTRFFQDQKWVQDTALPTINALLDLLMVEAQKVNLESQLQFEYGVEPLHAILRQEVSLEVSWRQPYRNSIEEVALDCAEYNGRVNLRKEGISVMFREPSRIGRKLYHPVLNLNRELRWVDKSKPREHLSNDDVVQKIH